MGRDVIDLCSSPNFVDLANDGEVEDVFSLTDDELEVPKPVFESLCEQSIERVLWVEQARLKANGTRITAEVDASKSPTEANEHSEHSEETQEDEISPFSSPLLVGERRAVRAAFTPENSPPETELVPPSPPQLVAPKKRLRFANTAATSQDASAGKRVSRAKSVKKRTDRAETAQDMVVEFVGDASFIEEATEALRKVPVREVRRLPPVEDGVVIVRLSRVVCDRFDSLEDMFVPAEQHEEQERTALVVITGDSFLDVLLDDAQHRDYFDHLAELATAPSVIYIVQGLQAIVRRHQNRYNRVIQRRARAYMEGSQPADLSPISRDRIDPAAVFAGQTRLQVRCGVNALYSAGDSRTSDWIVDLVQDLSLARYRTRYTDHPTVKSGNTPEQCTAEALVRLARVTPAVAARIQSVYPNMASLLHALCTLGPQCMVQRGLTGKALADCICQALCGSAAEDLVN